MKNSAFDMYIQEIQEILAMLDGTEYPETHGFLTSLVQHFPEGMLPREMAENLLMCDRTTEMPEYLVNYTADLLTIGGEEGDAEAWNSLGAQYYGGYRGFEQNFSRAMELYHKAAANGSRQAQENLGYCYYYGRDGEVDYEKAFHYFALGAFDGHLISLYKIGDMYRNGYYVEKNEQEALLIYMHCLDTMTEEYEMDVAGPVSLRLGDMFLNGQGTEANPLSALVSYQKAEVYLYNMVRNGDDMYRKSLMNAIEGQKKAREQLELPEKTWTIDG